MTEIYLTCIYCGKPNIHPERLYRYCTDDSCTKDAQAMVFPKYPTTAIENNTAEVMERNTILSDSLDSAYEKINGQQQEINKLKDAIVNLATTERRNIESECRVARWDVIRFIVKQHQNLEMGLEIIKDNPGKDDLFEDIYREHISFYDHGLKRLGIESVGTFGEQVSVDHACHDSDHPQGTPAVIIKHGYYFSEDDYYVQKPLVISLEEWERRNPQQKDIS
jgi:hypothetical protein